MDSGYIHIFFRDPHRLALILALIAGAVGAFLVYRSTDPPVSKPRRWVMAILRFIAVACIVFMLADPVLVAFHKEDIMPTVAILVDDTESIKVPDNTGDRAGKIIEFLDSKTIKEIERNYPVYKFALADTIYPFEKLNFDGKVTAIGDALSEILDTAQSLNIGALILISDGESNIGIDPVSVSATMPFPVFTVGIGDPNPAPDVAVAQVLANPVAYAGEKTPIVAYIRAWRLDGKGTKVSLVSENSKLAEQNIELPSSGQSIPVKFEVVPEEPGLQYYTVRLPKIAGEVTTSNNSQSVAIKILPSRKKILLACNHPSFEVAFFRRALKSDPHLEIDIYSAQGGGNVPFRTFPTDTAKLNEYDALILIHAGHILTASVAGRIRDYVRGGGSLLWIVDDSKVSPDGLKTLGEILPVIIDPSMKFVFDEFVPAPAEKAYTHPVMKITRHGEDLSTVIAKIPPFAGFMPSQPAPWASILMAHSENNMPVLAVGEINTGRSAILTASPIWRWGFLPFGFGGDSHIYQKLVANLAQYLVAKEKISRFVLTPGKRVYRSGEPVLIAASVRDLSNQPVSGAVVNLTVSRTAVDSADEFSVEMTEIGEGVYEVKLPSLEPGKYRLSGNAQKDDSRIGNAKTTLVVEEFRMEFAQTNQDRAALEAIAELSGGIYMPVDSAQILAQKIDLKPRMRSWTSESELWNRWWLLIAVIVSLAIEWLLRKRSNLM